MYSVHLDTSAEECMSIRTNKRFRHLPVCPDERLVGVVSIGDVVNAIIREQAFAIGDREGFIMGKYLG